MSSPRGFKSRGLMSSVIMFRDTSFMDTSSCTDKKEKKNVFIYREIQSGAVAKSYMRKGFLIFEEMRKYFPIYEEAR
jgi:hypothetical protein